eukprot:2964769-Prymnesium_polylepis.1
MHHYRGSLSLDRRGFDGGTPLHCAPVRPRLQVAWYEHRCPVCHLIPRALVNLARVQLGWDHLEHAGLTTRVTRHDRAHLSEVHVSLERAQDVGSQDSTQDGNPLCARELIEHESEQLEPIQFRGLVTLRVIRGGRSGPFVLPFGAGSGACKA